MSKYGNDLTPDRKEAIRKWVEDSTGLMFERATGPGWLRSIAVDGLALVNELLERVEVDSQQPASEQGEK